ncbi:TetR/AcrR family transcriptional regulator [Aminipila sp.]|uniref:TetR/AcrR family transcriptional regulator n=1 Tax=Aminipila sp. TaxID=2060095 RepID=UPI002896C116|nr:TetR/AcrR family transcriptional regulator [Aminipila sp.]
MNKRQEQKERTREHLIQVAFEQFSENGLTSTKTADIAAAAQVSHGTVFSHFPTREVLLETVIEDVGSKIAKRMHELAEKSCGMKEMLEAHLKGIAEYEDFYIRLISEASLLDRVSKNTLIMIQSAISFHLIQVAEQGMKRKQIKQIPLPFLFNTWLGLIHYYLMNKELFAPKESVISVYGAEWIDYFMNLISLEEGGNE